ncbi:MAG: dephospho-CoA kinase [Acidimicrobiia bacterium]|nr:dephospho-CoA kinase [Acidimicrobiia bacterium]
MNDHRHTRLILSGGIGSGKSAVGGLLSARGIPVIHADMIGHAVLEPEGEAFHPVSAWWPEVLVDGVIDRAKLAQIVFSDPKALEELESMTHPAIAARVLNLVEAHADAELVVVELPLLLPLLGEGWIRVVVDAPQETRRRRLAERGMGESDIDGRMAAQPTGEEWRAVADHVIDNSGTLAELEAEVGRLLEELQQR